MDAFECLSLIADCFDAEKTRVLAGSHWIRERTEACPLFVTNDSGELAG